MELQELQQEVAALHALVRGLVALSMAGDNLACTKSSETRRNFNTVRPADLAWPEGGKTDVGMAQMRVSQLMQEARTVAEGCLSDDFRKSGEP
jgi:hypothetical protein